MSARGDATRSRLLEATVQLVAEVGYARTTTRAIAQAAGVAEGTLYRHFPDKAALLVEAVVHRHRDVVEEVAQLPERAGEGTVAGTLTRCLLRLAELREDVVPLELAMLTDPELAQARATRTDRPTGPPEDLARYLQAEQRLGRVRADVDPLDAALTLLAMLFGVATMPPGAGTTAQRVAAAVDLVVTGLAPGQREA